MGHTGTTVSHTARIGHNHSRHTLHNRRKEAPSLFRVFISRRRRVPRFPLRGGGDAPRIPLKDGGKKSRLLLPRGRWLRRWKRKKKRLDAMASLHLFSYFFSLPPNRDIFAILHGEKIRDFPFPQKRERHTQVHRKGSLAIPRKTPIPPDGFFSRPHPFLSLF